MNSTNSKIGFIGCGNMGEALIKGLLDKRIVSKSHILVSDSRPLRRTYISNEYKVKAVSSNKAAASGSNIILLATKPQDIDQVLVDIYKYINSNKLIISIAAGVNVRYLQDNLPACRIIRVMPNTPALVAQGITGICKTDTARAKDFKITKRIFNSIGEVMEVKEKFIDAVTATSGSGPAYFFLLMDAMIKAAVSCGLERKKAEKLVLNTALGSAVLALHSKNDVNSLIKRVASKGGTTEAALKVFKKKKFHKIVNQAVKAATKRSKELSK